MNQREKSNLVEAYFMVMKLGFANSSRETPEQINLRLSKLHPEGNCSFEKGVVPGIPGSKIVTLRLIWPGHDLTVVDMWQTTPHSRRSFGTTTINSSEGVLWMMQYWGEYAEKAIPYLKIALNRSYNCLKFVGGRGPHAFLSSADGEMIYTNMLLPGRESFEHFAGKEEIRDSFNNSLLGWHEYHGMQVS